LASSVVSRGRWRSKEGGSGRKDQNSRLKEKLEKLGKNIQKRGGEEKGYQSLVGGKEEARALPKCEPVSITEPQMELKQLIRETGKGGGKIGADLNEPPLGGDQRGKEVQIFSTGKRKRGEKKKQSDDHKGVEDSN